MSILAFRRASNNSRPSDYTGATSVAACRLSVHGILGDTAVAILAAAELGGSGSIAGPVSVAAGGLFTYGSNVLTDGEGFTVRILR